MEIERDYNLCHDIISGTTIKAAGASAGISQARANNIFYSVLSRMKHPSRLNMTIPDGDRPYAEMFYIRKNKSFWLDRLLLIKEEMLAAKRWAEYK